jgi:colanic acid/amylovoran biosynthesis glycosyltransferase
MTTFEQITPDVCSEPAAAAPSAPRAGLSVAFLLSQYPAVSHTFLLQEVLGLRARGFRIETASINPPDRPLRDLPAQEVAEAGATHYIKDGKPARALWHALHTALLHPGVVFRGLTAILRLPNLTLRQRTRWLFYLLEALLVGRWMNSHGLRHLHVHFGGAVASVGYLTSIAWKLPYSLTIHGPEELLNTGAYQLRDKLRQASFVFCISDFCRSQLCQLTPPAQWSKFTVIRLGVDPARLMPPHRARPANAPLRLVCTGRLVPAKGHQILLEALKLLNDRGIQLHATLIGDGPERARLENFVRFRDLQKSITFTSSLSHPETLNYVREADIFVLASFAEGIPVALMEAMSFAVPCISTTIAGIPELISSGKDGLLVPPANAFALADAIQTLANDPALRAFLGHSARRRILSDYNLPLNHELLAHSFQTRLAQCLPCRLSAPVAKEQTA